MKPICSRLATVAMVVTLAASAFLASPRPAAACPNCKEAVSAQPADVARMADGYNWSIVFMIAVPFSLLGTGAFMVRRAAQQGLLPEL
jgi:hypothetical protein